MENLRASERKCIGIETNSIMCFGLKGVGDYLWITNKYCRFSRIEITLTQLRTSIRHSTFSFWTLLKWVLLIMYACNQTFELTLTNTCGHGQKAKRTIRFRYYYFSFISKIILGNFIAASHWNLVMKLHHEWS